MVVCIFYIAKQSESHKANMILIICETICCNSESNGKLKWFKLIYVGFFWIHGFLIDTFLCPLVLVYLNLFLM